MTLSVLLTFSLADLEEERKNFTDCHTLYENLLSLLASDTDELKIAVVAEVNAARGPEIPGPLVDSGEIGMNGGSEVARLVEDREVRGRMVAEGRGKDVDELATAMSVVWVMYMRFARRAEVNASKRIKEDGLTAEQGIKAARGIFGKARKSSHLTWHVFEASGE